MDITKVLTDNDLSNIEKIVLMYLYDINKGNSVTLSSKYIANAIGMTRATIIKAIKGLIDKGIVVKNNNSNMYDGVTANTYNLKVRKYI
jgi:DNA-binding MarR family transcriptional regulator